MTWRDLGLLFLWAGGTAVVGTLLDPHPSDVLAVFIAMTSGILLGVLARGIFARAEEAGKASAIEPVKEVQEFDKTGWTPVGWQPPQDTVRPIFVMRSEWDTPSFWPEGWGVGKNPYMNIVGLYWKYADKEER